MNLQAMMFTDTLGLIKNERLRGFAKIAVAQFNPYFFEIPASSSGKYHSDSDRAYGGLVHHTKSTVLVFNQFMRTEQFNITEHEADLGIIALICHDSMKNGSTADSGRTLSKHPILASRFVRKLQVPTIYELTKEELDIVCNCIERHSGIWNRDYVTQEEIMGKPETELEKVVHLSDYIASRKEIEISLTKGI